jgi:fucose permease
MISFVAGSVLVITLVVGAALVAILIALVAHLDGLNREIARIRKSRTR